MRWEPQSGGWVLRISFTDPCIGHRFAGLIYPATKGFIWEVFERDMAGLADSLEAAKKMVEREIETSERVDKT